MHTRSRRGLVAAALLAVPALLIGGSMPSADAARAAHRRSFTREVEPWIPGSPPSSPPAVKLTAACVRRVGGGKLEAVFGYKNLSPVSVYVGLDPHVDVPEGNVIVRETRHRRPSRRTTEIEALGPQATLFLPGTHRHVFAVRFRSNQTVAWRVRVPSFDDPVLDPGWEVTVRPRRLARCGRRVPDHFAVVQAASVSSGPTNIRDEDGGGITAYDVEFTAQSVNVVCSDGGRVLPFKQVVGWTIEPNLVPLRPGEIVEEIVTSDGARFQMSKTRVRRVVDVFQPVEWFGPIADVIGRCAFRGEVVRSEVFWAGQPANGSITPVVVDGAVVGLKGELVLPGGIRIR